MKFSLISFLLFGCITTKDSSTLNVEAGDPASEISTLSHNSGTINYFIYKPTLYPLASFFDHLLDGALVDAFTNANLKYQSSNTDNLALQKLIDNGYIPVWLEFQNKSPKMVILSSSNFNLSDGKTVSTLLNLENIPIKFVEFNTTALSANTWNTTLVVGSVALLLAAIAYSRGGGTINPGGISGRHWNDDSNDFAWNSLDHSTNIAYGDLLFNFSKPIKTEEIRKGIVFAKLNQNYVDWNNLKLVRFR